MGVRWNGDNSNSGIGNPQSRGLATWFIVPKELQEVILEKAKALSGLENDILMAGYKEMAQDEQTEEEALQWSELLIGDIVHETC